MQVIWWKVFCILFFNFFICLLWYCLMLNLLYSFWEYMGIVKDNASQISRIWAMMLDYMLHISRLHSWNPNLDGTRGGYACKMIYPVACMSCCEMIQKWWTSNSMLWWLRVTFSNCVHLHIYFLWERHAVLLHNFPLSPVNDIPPCLSFGICHYIFSLDAIDCCSPGIPGAKLKILIYWRTFVWP